MTDSRLGVFGQMRWRWGESKLGEGRRSAMKHKTLLAIEAGGEQHEQREKSAGYVEKEGKDRESMQRSTCLAVR